MVMANANDTTAVVDNVVVDNIDEEESSCSSPSTIRIGGSSTVDPLITAWIDGYSANSNSDNLDKYNCQKFDFVVESQCGSSCGARRVCDQHEQGSDDGGEEETPLDVGDMSRDWKQPDEATIDAANEYLWHCSGSERSVVQIDVAIEGLSIVVPTGGVGEECIAILGGGLTLDQLRWMYSGFTTDQLVESGWDQSSLQNDDGDDTTHFWSELHPDCPAVEILISGPDRESGTYDFFTEKVFNGSSDEDHPFGVGRPQTDGSIVNYVSNPSSQIIVEFLASNPASISYIGYIAAEVGTVLLSYL